MGGEVGSLQPYPQPLPACGEGSRRPHPQPIPAGGEGAGGRGWLVAAPPPTHPRLRGGEENTYLLILNILRMRPITTLASVIPSR